MCPHTQLHGSDADEPLEHMDADAAAAALVPVDVTHSHSREMNGSNIRSTVPHDTATATSVATEDFGIRSVPQLVKWLNHDRSVRQVRPPPSLVVVVLVR